MGHARALITLENNSLQIRIFKQVLSKNLSVREVESLVRENGNRTSPLSKRSIGESDPKLMKIEGDLNARLNTKVKLQMNKKGAGTITIPFTSEVELNKIIELLES